jgi:hypothetical protein
VRCSQGENASDELCSKESGASRNQGERVAVSAHQRPGGGWGMDGRPLLLLTVPGRRSGALRTVPVVYFDQGGGYLVVGTGMGGSKRTPEWF